MYRIIDKIKANRVSSQCLYTYNVQVVAFQMFLCVHLCYLLFFKNYI